MTQTLTAQAQTFVDRPSPAPQTSDSPPSDLPATPRRDLYQELIALIFYAYDFF
jgi:hypothetical protein